MNLPESIQNAVLEFTKIPGIGGKTALRQVMAMLNWSDEQRNLFSDAVLSLNDVVECVECGMFSEDDFCAICSNPKREEARSIRRGVDLLLQKL